MKLLAFFLVPVTLMLVPRVAFAHCPLCVAGAVAGVSVTRWIGVDDSITGVWIAALLGATSFWTDSFVRRNLTSLGEPTYVLFFAVTRVFL
jgi:hypothetical protein